MEMIDERHASVFGTRYPFGVPDGWYVVERSHNLSVGDLKTLEYFGKKLVLFRGQDGKARLLDAYCDHLGAHLGKGGTVKGNHLRCPFHHWEWNGEGRCANIPYTDRIPPTAKVASYPVDEHSGMIWAWYHSKGEAPQYSAPPTPFFDDPDWKASCYSIDWILNAHAQEIYENGADYQHFPIVHQIDFPENVDTKYTENELVYTFHTSNGTDSGDKHLAVIHNGRIMRLGVSFVHMIGNMEVLVQSATTPISAEKTHVRFDVLGNIRKPDPETALAFIASYSKSAADAFHQDFEIWENKKYLSSPKLCNRDGPINIFRKWASRFYS